MNILVSGLIAVLLIMENFELESEIFCTSRISNLFGETTDATPIDLLPENPSDLLFLCRQVKHGAGYGSTSSGRRIFFLDNLVKCGPSSDTGSKSLF